MRNATGSPASGVAWARALDAEILAAIERWHVRGSTLDEAEFDDLALRLFEYQRRYNRPYADYCAALGVSESAPALRSWHDIPAVPAAAFKEAPLATFDPAAAALVFETSGTTGESPGTHFLETAALYDAALSAGFDRFMLPDGARLQYLNLVPNPAQRPRSSLGYMMARVARERGGDRTGWYLQGEALAFDAFVSDARAAAAADRPVCIAATAFALSHVLDRMDRIGLRLSMAAGSRVMETGGFKGRARVVDRAELYARAASALGIGPSAIVAEYGMTELSSQYYDDVLLGTGGDVPGPRRKVAPPWLRTRVVGPNGRALPDGTVGALVHVDLANRSSCMAIATEDLGVRLGRHPPAAGDPGLVLIGRERGAALRGCSLDAEALLQAGW